MDKLFVDSSAYIGLYNYRDTRNKEAVLKASSMREKGMRGVSSNYIIDEVITHLLIHAGYKSALEFGRQVFEETSEIEFLTIDEILEKEAWQVFKKYNKDKLWSFTDCTSYVLMKSLGINTAFTFDHRDFRQMGFKIL